MLEKNMQEQHIIELLKVHYGIEIQSLERLPFGADMNALVFKANAKSRSYFVKIKFGNHEETHISIIRFLHDAGMKEVIFPISTIDGNYIKNSDLFKMIVYPFIDGQNGFEKKLSKNHWIELGKVLKKIHTLALPSSLQKQLRKETFSSKWREAVRSLIPNIELNISDNNIVKDFKIFFNANIDSINQLVNSAEESAKKNQSNPHSFVLCHSDIHAGNVLITSDEFYIVDWDDPMMAPKERDLMFIGGGVGNVWNLPQEIDYFYQGYGEPNIDKTFLSYYRSERIVEDIALYGQDILSQNQSDQAKLISFKHFQSMFEPNGVVDIALSSDET